jgi:hypothetical protein
VLRSWLDAWWSRFALGPLIGIAGVLLGEHSLGADPPDSRGAILGALCALIGLLMLLVGPRRLDAVLRVRGERRK